MRLLISAVVLSASLAFAQHEPELRKKESHAPAALPLKSRAEKPPDPKPAFVYSPPTANVERMQFEKRQEMIRQLEELLRLEQGR